MNLGHLISLQTCTGSMARRSHHDPPSTTTNADGVKLGRSRISIGGFVRVGNPSRPPGGGVDLLWVPDSAVVLVGTVVIFSTPQESRIRTGITRNCR